MSRERQSIKAPTWSMVAFRSVFVLTISAFAFASYSLIRPLFGTFGFDLATIIKSHWEGLALGSLESRNSRSKRKASSSNARLLTALSACSVISIPWLRR